MLLLSFLSRRCVVDPYNLFYYYCFSCGWIFIIIAQRTTLLCPEIIYLFHLNRQSKRKFIWGNFAPIKRNVIHQIATFSLAKKSRIVGCGGGSTRTIQHQQTIKSRSSLQHFNLSCHTRLLHFKHIQTRRKERRESGSRKFISGFTGTLVLI